jgi:hypothetical protein
LALHGLAAHGLAFAAQGFAAQGLALAEQGLAAQGFALATLAARAFALALQGFTFTLHGLKRAAQGLARTEDEAEQEWPVWALAGAEARARPPATASMAARLRLVFMACSPKWKA